MQKFVMDNNQILTIVSLVIGFIGLIIGLISFLDTVIENIKATKKLSYPIIGEWYSAEYNLKQGQATNAILTIEIKRRFWSRNNIRITNKERPKFPLDQATWNGKGKVIADNTLSINWEGDINTPVRCGTCFVKFTEEKGNIGIGHWIGYSSTTTMLPVNGYWILCRKMKKLPKENEEQERIRKEFNEKSLEKLNELAELALKEFIFFNVSNLLEYRKT